MGLAKNKLARATDVFFGRKTALMKMRIPENIAIKKMEECRLGHWLRALFLAEDWDSVLKTHILAYNHLSLQFQGI